MARSNRRRCTVRMSGRPRQSLAMRPCDCGPWVATAAHDMSRAVTLPSRAARAMRLRSSSSSSSTAAISSAPPRCSQIITPARPGLSAPGARYDTSRPAQALQLVSFGSRPRQSAPAAAAGRRPRPRSQRAASVRPRCRLREGRSAAALSAAGACARVSTEMAHIGGGCGNAAPPAAERMERNMLGRKKLSETLTGSAPHLRRQRLEGVALLLRRQERGELVSSISAAARASNHRA